jgi:hypothetical protein
MKNLDTGAEFKVHDFLGQVDSDDCLSKYKNCIAGSATNLTACATDNELTSPGNAPPSFPL